MSRQQHYPVEFLPILSRGRHRRPRKGACFMEFASYLAGERWSDHPACTHPLLASLARQVNDLVADDARQRLVEYVPDVIGLTSRDPRVDVVVALRAALTALPVAAEEDQRVMAAAVLNCERLAAELDGRADAELSEESREALESAPAAAAWAAKFVRRGRISRRVFRRQTAPAIITCAVHGVARSCTPDPDRLLTDLLIAAIADCKRFLRAGSATPAAVPEVTPAPAG